MADPFSDLWTSFRAWVDAHPSGDWFFRGQGGDFPVVPKLGRAGYRPTAAEEALFRLFLRAALPLPWPCPPAARPRAAACCSPTPPT